MNPVDEFLKEASWGAAFSRGLGSQGFGHAMAEGAGRALPGIMVGLGLAAGSNLMSKGISAASERLTKTRDYKAMLKSSPGLKEYDAGQVQMVYNSLRSQSPTMAKDPLIAGSFVRRTMEMSPESGPFIDPQTVKTIAEAQRNVSQARKDRGGLSDAFQMTTLPPALTGPERADTSMPTSKPRTGSGPRINLNRGRPPGPNYGPTPRRGPGPGANYAPRP